MKLAFTTLACPKWSWDEILANAKRYGYEGIELRFIRDQRDLTQVPEFQLAALPITKRQLADAQLKIPCVDTSCVLTTADTAALDKARALMDLAVALECSCVRVFGGNLPKENPERAFDLAAKNFRALADYGKSRSVRPLLETHDDFIDTPLVLELLNATSHSNMGVLWDTHHPFRFAEELPADTYEHLLTYIHHVHIKDSLATPDGDCQYKLLGEGDVPVAKFVDLLKRGNYKGWLSVEWEKFWQPNLPEPEIALPQYIAALKKML